MFLAIIGAGAVFLGSNPGYKELELTNLLETANPRLIIAAPDLLSTLQTVTKELRISNNRVLVLKETSDIPLEFASWSSLFEHGEEDWIRFDNEARAKETAACLVTTSGTTGLPKLAILSHYSWIAFNSVIDDPVGKPYEIRR